MARKEIKVQDVKVGDVIGFTNFIPSTREFEEISKGKVDLIVRDDEFEAVALRYQEESGRSGWLVCDFDDLVDRWEP